MSKTRAALAAITTCLLVPVSGLAQEPAANMSFFVTSSPLDGGNLGGLEGADAHCQSLAEAVGAGDRTWQAYLSVVMDDGTEIDARSRIGEGPWYNARGVMIAENVDELHLDNNVRKNTALMENGQVLNGRGDNPNRHDILTGSTPDGVAIDEQDLDCEDWTSNSDDASGMVGHHDRVGGGGLSWNAQHPSAGCSLESLRGTGGDGRFYCFAID